MSIEIGASLALGWRALAWQYAGHHDPNDDVPLCAVLPLEEYHRIPMRTTEPNGLRLIEAHAAGGGLWVVFKQSLVRDEEPLFLTNGAEGVNAVIQEVKKTTRGFRNAEHSKTAIHFHCGGLDLYPHESR